MGRLATLMPLPSMLPSPSDSCEVWGEALLHGEASYKVILWNGDRGPAGHFDATAEHAAEPE